MTDQMVIAFSANVECIFGHLISCLPALPEPSLSERVGVLAPELSHELKPVGLAPGKAWDAAIAIELVIH